MGDLVSALLEKTLMKKVLDTRKKKERYDGLKDVETHKKNIGQLRKQNFRSAKKKGK